MINGIKLDKNHGKDLAKQLFYGISLSLLILLKTCCKKLII